MATVRPSSILLGALMYSLFISAVAIAAANYEESLKQLAEGVTAEAIKAKKHRLAFLDLTDTKGQPTATGRFIAEEIGTQLLIAGELQVVEPQLVQSTLKKFQVSQVDPGHAKAVRRAAKAMRADVFVSGSYLESADGVTVTVKLISPLNAQVVGAARGTLSTIGPLAEMLKEAHNPPVTKPDGPREPSVPPGLGFHRNDYYDFVVQSIEREGLQAKMDVTIENRSARDLKVLCLLQDTILKDDHGASWLQAIEENRDGLCTRGLELSAHEKARTVLTFTAPADALSSQFTLHYHEKSPRRDATFTIDGLKVQPVTSPIP